MPDTHIAVPPGVLATRQPDTRWVPLDALKKRSLIGADVLLAPETRTPVDVAAFNASL